MPLLYQHIINTDTRLGIWKIEEEEAFFLFRAPLQRSITHPHKRLQHLAGRYLLQHLFPGFPYELIEIAGTRKPFLRNEAFHFSISHCGDYAAAIASSVNRVGIDIELVKPVIEKIQYKFLSNTEISLLQHYDAGNDRQPDRYAELLTVCWSAKEAMYKWYGKGGIDFRQHMQIVSFSESTESGSIQAVFTKETFVRLHIAFSITRDFVTAWIVSEG